MPELFSETLMFDIEEKKAFLHRHHIALWDVLASCEIKGAEDASIRREVPNDLSSLLSGSRIHAIFTNGQKASLLYRKYFGDFLPVTWISLPSTSPANCRNWTYETLLDAYRVILDYL